MRALVVVADGTSLSVPDNPPEAVVLEFGRIVRGDGIGARMWQDWQYPVQREGMEGERNWTRAFLAPLRLIGRHELAGLKDALCALTLPAAGRCATCDRTVSRGEQDYCRDQSERFDGKTHCYTCQQSLRRGSHLHTEASLG